MADLSTIIRDAYRSLCRLDRSESKIDVVHANGVRFIGIDFEHAADISLSEARKLLLDPFPARENTKIIQIIGDSGTPVRSDKVTKTQQLLDRQVANDTVIEYGFTRSDHDANWFVEDLATRNPVLISRLVGNIVQVTADSIKPPAWSAYSEIEHLVFVHRRNGPPTSFGDDVWLSDGMMTAEAEDVMVCLEGGPQAFRQCVNVLLAKVKVIAVTGLREDEAAQRFSAAGLLAYIMQHNLSEENVSTYLLQHPPKAEAYCESIRKDIQRLLGIGLQTNDLLIEIEEM